MRKRYPALAFSVLFFFAGQLLESSVLPLELYFEHRSYLPALPMFWPLALWLCAPGQSLRGVRMALAGMLPVLLALLTYQRAGQWGTPYEQALLFALASPDSTRAQVYSAAYQGSHGDVEGALLRLRRANNLFPDDPQITLTMIDIECKAGAVSGTTLEKALVSIRTNTNMANYIHNWLSNRIPEAANGRCAGLDLDAMQRVHLAEQSNPNFPKGPAHQSDLQIEAGSIDLALGHGEEALRHFNEAMSLLPSPDGAWFLAARLGGSGFPGLGARHLEYYKTLPQGNRGLHDMAAVHLWLLNRYGFWDQELARVEAQLLADAQAQQQSSQSRTPAPTAKDAARP
jgi:tetratricopeptide (TPR) repeat protein